MKRFPLRSLTAFGCILLAQHIFAAARNDAPLGPAGGYNGSITTGGSYDPYTGNAKRFVDDLVVTGSLGAYPLKWTRALNTRNINPWEHSYKWALTVVPYEYYHYYPDLYEGVGGEVDYPDGRVMTFAKSDAPYEYGENSGASEAQDSLVHRGPGRISTS
jgi:hypothetical protein